MYCLRVFIQELHVYYNVYHYYISVCIEMHVYTKLYLVWFLRQRVTCPSTCISIIMYSQRLFIVVLQELQCCLHVDIIRIIDLSFHHVLFAYTFWFLR